MGFGQFKSLGGNSGKPMTAMSDINVTPMVDVMLVLLVIFIIAAPLLNHAVRLDLPSAQAEAVPQDIDTVTLSFDAQGALFWDAELVKLDELEKRLALIAKQKPQPEILLRADKSTRFELIAQVMAAAQNNGLNKIGFATEAKSVSQPTKSSTQNASNAVKK
jgi:biopolymer transport protein ExbD